MINTAWNPFYPLNYKDGLYNKYADKSKLSNIGYQAIWIANWMIWLCLHLKEKLPQAFMQIEWMENDFRNLTAKVWANLDNPIKP